MTECVKIKCDDCKFVEDCVDYGWDGCRKFTPKPSEPMTNHEWLHTLSTEQLAEVLNKMTLSCYICGQDSYNENPRHCIFGRCTGKEDIAEWLKQPHKE